MLPHARMVCQLTVRALLAITCRMRAGPAFLLLRFGQAILSAETRFGSSPLLPMGAVASVGSPGTSQRSGGLQRMLWPLGFRISNWVRLSACWTEGLPPWTLACHLRYVSSFLLPHLGVGALTSRTQPILLLLQEVRTGVGTVGSSFLLPSPREGGRGGHSA